MQIHTYIYLYIYENYLVKSFNVIKYHRDQIAMPSKLNYLRIFFFFFTVEENCRTIPIKSLKVTLKHREANRKIPIESS